MARKKEMDPEAMLRLRMTKEQIESRGVTDPTVLAVMRAVPRHLFVTESYRSLAYTDQPLPSYDGQTISQPYIVAAMTELLAPRKHHRALEVGTGTGYQTAVLAELVREVYTVEVSAQLLQFARSNLETLGYRNVWFFSGNGYYGWPSQAPFDLVLVTAAPPFLPERLVAQLAPGGRMVVPIGSRAQQLNLVTKTTDGRICQKALFSVSFVPLVDSGP